jgi:hypothetical protein
VFGLKRFGPIHDYNTNVGVVSTLYKPLELKETERALRK